jgi:hypothetical protein
MTINIDQPASNADWLKPDTTCTQCGAEFRQPTDLPAPTEFCSERCWLDYDHYTDHKAGA